MKTKRRFSVNKYLILLFVSFFSVFSMNCGGKSSGGDTTSRSYCVIYSDNGATGGIPPVDGSEYKSGQLATVLGNAGNLAKKNFSFNGWNTAADGSGTTYTQSQYFAINNADAVLYAKWSSAPTYSVTYDINGATGGTVPTDNIRYEQGQLVTVLSNSGSLMKNGFTFAGWNTATDGTGTTYTQTQTFLMGNANKTLYAKWVTGTTYTVTYNSNGATSGTVPSDSTNYQFGQTAKVLANIGNLAKTTANTYYTFDGWNTSSDGKGTACTPALTLTVGNSNVTLYAMWKVKKYTVTYNSNGATAGMVPIDFNQYQQGETVEVYDNTGNLTQKYRRFAGWNTAADGSGTTYKVNSANSSFPISNTDVTLYALWDGKWETTYFPADAGFSDLAIDSSGMVYAVGNILSTSSGYSGHVYRLASTWIDIGSCTNDRIFGIASDSSYNVYVCGFLSNIANVNVEHFAHWNRVQWTGMGDLLGYCVWSVACDSSGNVYAGGLITKAGTTSVSNIAKWNGTSWMALGSGIVTADPSSNNGGIGEMIFDSSNNLYAAGGFVTAGGLTVNNIAKWNGTSWSALDSGLNAGVGAMVFDAAGNLYVGGSFTTAGGNPANYIAKWDGASWSTLGTGFDGYVNTLVFDTYGNLYAGGEFHKADGKTAKHIAMWNGTSWTAVGTGTDGEITCMKIDSSGTIYVGGHFTTVGEYSYRNLAKLMK